MARPSRAMSLVAAVAAQWSSRVSSVELDPRGSFLHFALRERARRAPREFRDAAPGGPTARCYAVLVCGGDRVPQARLHRDLGDWLRDRLPAGCDPLPLSSYLPRVRDSLVRGYFLRDASVSGPPSLTEWVLRDLHREHRDALVMCSYRRRRKEEDEDGEDGEEDEEEDGSRWSQHLWSSPPEESQDKVQVHGSSRCLYVVPCEAPDYHPSVLNIANSDVFYSLAEACKVLEECRDIIPESRAVLQLVGQTAAARQSPGSPVVVIEGLDATGKTTLTQSLREALGASLLQSPPQCLSPWRARFDQEPPLIRRAFYAVGNYITARQMGQGASQAPVIVDRYWHSTAAYAIATAVSGPVSNLPPEGSELYLWPADLPQPSLVVLLTLDPQERRRRLQDRGQGQTNEEQQLDHNHLFRLRVEEAYRRIRGPVCVAVDAAPSADKVLQQVLLLIRDNCRS
ncbi:unnamed protein product [Merluccius merluccius]